MFVIGSVTYSDIKYLGSQRKVSVELSEVSPCTIWFKGSGIMPDLAFKAPTFKKGIQVCFYTARWVS